MRRLPVQAMLCSFCIFLLINSAQAQQFKWVKGGGTTEDFTGLPSNENERTTNMCADPSGNIYALNQVGNNPIIADTFYRSGAYGSNGNILLTSYNCDGQMRWAKLIATSGIGCLPFDIKTDNIGNVYVSGFFNADGSPFYIGYDTTISPPASDYLIVGVIRFDTSGNFKWIRYVGQNTFAGAMLIGSEDDPLAIDGSNNVHYFCYMESGVSLMPAVTSVYGVYDLTYNTAGTLLSAVRLDLDSQWQLRGALIDPTTNKLYVYGEVNQSLGLTDSFYAAAFDPSRHQLWQYFCGHGDDDGFTGIVMDASKNLYFSGSSQSGHFSFHNDSVVETSGNEMAVAMRTDTNGNVKWIKHYDNGVAALNWFGGVALLPNDKVVVAGTFEGSVIGSGVSLSTPAGEGESPYFVILDSGGNLQAVQQIHGDAGENEALAVASDRVGNIYIGGLVTDSIWAGTPHIPAYHTVGGNSDFFVMKYGVDCSCTSAPIASYTDTGTHTVGVTYTGTTTGLDSVVWSYGDGTSGTGTSATHTYTASGTYNVCVTVYTTCGSDIHCSEVTIHIPSEVAPIVFGGGEVKIFPNPANDALNITGILQNTNYRLLNITGMSLSQGVLQQGSNVVSMSGFASGVYILEMSGEGGERSVVRVVKE